MERVFSWVTSLPPLALYGAMALTAGLENIFPPLPSDTIVAFGAFLAARGRALLVGVFLAIWAGNVSGAMLVYAIGYHVGGTRLQNRLLRSSGSGAPDRIAALYHRHGLVALFLSRFLPGARALVPPFAGALRMPAVPVFLAIGSASAIWYGIVTIVAYRVGRDFTVLRERLLTLSRDTALVAALLVVVLLAGWLLYRRMRKP